MALDFTCWLLTMGKRVFSISVFFFFQKRLASKWHFDKLCSCTWTVPENSSFAVPSSIASVVACFDLARECGWELSMDHFKDGEQIWHVNFPFTAWENWGKTSLLKENPSQIINKTSNFNARKASSNKASYTGIFVNWCACKLGLKMSSFDIKVWRPWVGRFKICLKWIWPARKMRRKEVIKPLVIFFVQVLW